jgi:hemoglobin
VATLWDRLGGQQGVGQVIDEIVAVAGKDKKVDFDRGGKVKLTPADLVKFRQEMIDWVSSKTGGPLKYTGETMKQAHKGMGITDAQFDAFVADVRGVLAKHNLRPDDEKAVLDTLEATRKDIVETKSGEEPKPEKKQEDKKPGESKEEKKPEASAGTSTVSGTVTYKGKPLPGGTVTLTGKDGKTVSGAIGEDGSYALQAVKPGTYTMTVDTSSAKGKAFVAIPEKYKGADTSGLTVQVNEGKQVHDIALTD